MTTMKAITQRFASRVGQFGLGLAALVATHAAMAVKDLPGGPGVNQLDLHEPVTQIAHDQRWLHYFMLVICTVIFVYSKVNPLIIVSIAGVIGWMGWLS